jgi:type II secretory pathway pseudopilin PulG
VVVSIIALLIGILLPAIGKARDNAHFTRSQANVKQIGTAYATYGAEWADRQPTYIDDYLSRYGTTFAAAWNAYTTSHNGVTHPSMWIGDDVTGQAAWRYDALLQVPYHFNSATSPVTAASTGPRFGGFRAVNAQAITLYINGRLYDPVLFAPKDTVVMNRIEEWFEHPAQVPANGGTWLAGSTVWPSYCYSPAAMFNPAVLGLNAGGFYTDPWTGGLESSFRSPSYSQAQYPTLKTMLLEHHWLQGRKRVCNPYMTATQGLECQPYFFNHATTSNPVCWYFDGHIAGAGATDAESADGRMIAQSAGQPGMPAAGWGLWSRNTPAPGGAAGYFMENPLAFEPWLQTSYHILTIDGIKGRDFIK